MRPSRGQHLALAVAASVAFGGCLTLDHFRVHEVDPIAIGEVVRLTDQFDAAAKEATVETLSYFANPSRKWGGGHTAGIKHGDHHFNWYAISQTQPEPRRTVTFRNQFGQHSVDVGDPRFLLVPAQKTSDPGSAFPADLDHYKCYEVVEVNSASPPPAVNLGDQFGGQHAAVGNPVLFCPPVQKERDGQAPIPILNDFDHLAVYDLPPVAQSRAISTKDQFGSRDLSVIQSVLLIVPTIKQEVTVHP
jgi:hypothetical protein